MATYNGSVSLNSSHFGCYLNVYESNENKVNNTHNVTAELHITRSKWGWQTSNSYSGSIVIDGTTFSFNYSPNWSYSSSGDVIVGSATKTVTHNSNGTKSCGVSATWNTSGTYSCGIASASGTLTLTTIPRASGIACSSPYIGDTATVTIDKKSNDFTNTVSYAIGSISGTLATKTSATVLSLTTEDIADQIYALIPNSKQIQSKIYCSTYSGDTKIGDTTEAAFYLYAKESECKPTVTGTIVDTNPTTIAITEDSGVIVKYASIPKVTIQATANKGASISRYSINANDGQQVNLQEYTFEKGIASDTITISAIDSRGFETSINLTPQIIDYIPIVISEFYAERPEDVSNEIVLNASGIWFNDKFKAEKPNKLVCNYWYKSSEETEWSECGTIVPTIDGNTFKFENLSLGDQFSYEQQWQIKLRVQDLTGYAERDDLYVSKGREVLTVGEDKVWVYGDLLLNDNSLESEAITVGLDEQVFMGEQSYNTIPFTTIKSEKGAKLSHNNGVITIGAGIEYIKVSASIRFSNPAVQTPIIQIFKNDTVVAAAGISINSTWQNANVDFTPILVPVEQNDEITVRIHPNSSSGIYIRNTTYVTIEKV